MVVFLAFVVLVYVGVVGADFEGAGGAEGEAGLEVGDGGFVGGFDFWKANGFAFGFAFAVALGDSKLFF